MSVGRDLPGPLRELSDGARMASLTGSRPRNSSRCSELISVEKRHTTCRSTTETGCRWRRWPPRQRRGVGGGIVDQLVSVHGVVVDGVGTSVQAEGAGAWTGPSSVASSARPPSPRRASAATLIQKTGSSLDTVLPGPVQSILEAPERRPASSGVHRTAAFAPASKSRNAATRAASQSRSRSKWVGRAGRFRRSRWCLPGGWAPAVRA